ncbi:MAG: DUF362 domain-containing protein [Oscillospiraceae bacterium]|nr:DUF362 domain-containing protein [Oscillospiraceae bacterium]
MPELRKVPLQPIKPFSDIYISTGNGLIKSVLKRGFDALGGIEKFIKPSQSVLIKPNLTAAVDPITGGTTDVRLAAALVELIREHCNPGKIYCGENTLTGDMTRKAFEKYGYVDMCEHYGVELVDFTYAERVDVDISDAMYVNTVSFPKLVLDVDVFITLPLLKNHDTVCVTAAIKNSFGLASADLRKKTHRDFAIEQCLIDLARIRKPDFTIVDGRIGMEGIAGGTYFDHPRFANRMVMGADPVAVDVVCTHIMQQNPRVRYLQWADDYGLGNCNLDYINIHGMSIEQAAVPFMTPAEQIEEMTAGKIHLHDLGSCSRCRAVAQGTLHRFTSPESLIKSVDIIYGPGTLSKDTELGDSCILVGDCIQQKYRNLGQFIPGCPMNREDYFNTLTSMNIVCSKCEQTVLEFVKQHSLEELSFIRILASNKTVFQGSDNESGTTDYLLAVGDCQKRYVGYHLERTHEELKEMGLSDSVTADNFVVFIGGHEITLEQIESAFEELKRRRDA